MALATTSPRDEKPIFSFNDVKDIFAGALHFGIVDDYTFEKLMNRLVHDRDKKEFEAVVINRKESETK